MKRRSAWTVLLLFILTSTCFFSFGIREVYAKGTVKKDGWYCYRGWEGGKVSNYIYRKGDKLIVQGQLRKVKKEKAYPGKKLGRKKRSFELSKKVKIRQFTEEVETVKWKTLKEWGWYKKKHYSAEVYFRVKKGKVTYIGLHS